jgi:hypothetical protein
MTRDLLKIGGLGVVAAVVVGALHIAFMPWKVTGNTLNRSTSVDEPDEGSLRGPLNQIVFSDRPYDPDFDVGAMGMTGPMADQIYAQVWLDVSEEPMVLDIPDFGDRYFVMPIIDRWNRVNGYIGSRSTGGQGGRYAVVHEDWEGTLPPGVERITVRTDEVNILFRVFISGPNDFPEADALRRRTRLYPLSDMVG